MSARPALSPRKAAVISEIFKFLSPPRIRILLFLKREREANFARIKQALQVSSNTLKLSLREMKRLGMVKVNTYNGLNYYSLTWFGNAMANRIVSMSKFINKHKNFFSKWGW